MKKVAIIGAGLAGFSAGIYLLDNGFDVEIYEKHLVPGGQCTGWYREGVFIDGCMHWVNGTNPESELFPLYKHIGAFDENTKIYPTDYFAKFLIDGEEITFYSDLKLLKKELLRISPKDCYQIHRFIRGITTYQRIKVPVEKPIDMMNLFELIKFGFGMIPVAFKMLVYKHTSTVEYSKKFKSPILQKVFSRIIGPNLNIHSLFYTMKTLSKKDSGVPEGGSLKLALRVKDKYLSKGGKLFLNHPVDKIIVEDKKAKGLLLENGNKIDADYVISAADLSFTMEHLLEGKYFDKDYHDKITHPNHYPVHTSFYISYVINQDISHIGKVTNIETDEFEILGQKVDNIHIRNYSFDPSLNKNMTTMTIIITLDDYVYDDIKKLNCEEYLKLKAYIGEKCRQEIINKLNVNDENIKLLDVATPLTFERYNNAYKGAYMSFISTKHSKGLMRKGIVKGLNNFALCGQWIMPPGGLPIAIFTGKNAAYRVTKHFKKKWKNLESED